MEQLIIHQNIKEIRGMKVILDADLATLYQVETKRLNEVVKRHIKRFPPDFMFQLTNEECEHLRSQIATSKSVSSSKKKAGGTRYKPYAFTEQGIAMLSGLLNSNTAIEVNISIMRAFVLLRQYALSHVELTEQLHALEQKYDEQFNSVYDALNYLIQKEQLQEEQLSRRKIGF